jgi:hypothetical protein
MEHPGSVDQGLRGDAAPVQTLAAEITLLDERDLAAELSGPDRGHVAARAAADHEDFGRAGVRSGHSIHSSYVAEGRLPDLEDE